MKEEKLAQAREALGSGRVVVTVTFVTVILLKLLGFL